MSLKKSSNCSSSSSRPTGTTNQILFEEEDKCERYEEILVDGRNELKNEDEIIQREKSHGLDDFFRERQRVFVRGELPENTVVYVDYL